MTGSVRAGEGGTNEWSATIAFGGSVTAHDGNVARPTKDPLSKSCDKSANPINTQT
jgi:hypothetical protein